VQTPTPRPAAPPPQTTHTAPGAGSWEKALKSRPAPKNARQLVPDLKEIFKAQGVPPELVWLAEVESSMNPNAKSPVGAAGLFQFMPATAERFGMKVSPNDDRLDPRKSARAAAEYLKILHRRFDDWPLALAAYNAGEGRVGKLLKQHSAKTFDDISSRLPVETRMYVPKVMAMVALRENIDPATLPAPK
ncbi:MAG: lytic transglycosylase domain-containing protein, partial [Spartobacteria bacterium]|nr:lytic transglycosylase domain-containing protein [Spartobacteria bacterium]